MKDWFQFLIGNSFFFSSFKLFRTKQRHDVGWRDGNEANCFRSCHRQNTNYAINNKKTHQRTLTSVVFHLFSCIHAILNTESTYDVPLISIYSCFRYFQKLLLLQEENFLPLHASQVECNFRFPNCWLTRTKMHCDITRRNNLFFIRFYYTRKNDWLLLLGKR